MSIKKLEKIENTDSEEYRTLVSNIHFQFENLYKILARYSIAESGFYLKLAYKCFEKEIYKDLESKN